MRDTLWVALDNMLEVSLKTPVCGSCSHLGKQPCSIFPAKHIAPVLNNGRGMLFSQNYLLEYTILEVLR